MRSNMKRIAAMTMAALVAASAVSGAIAAEYSSSTLSVGDRIVWATPVPTPVTEATPAPENDAQAAATVTPEPTPEEFVVRDGWITATSASHMVATVCATPTGALVGQARHGDPVTVLERDGDWLHISCMGMDGWVLSRYVTYTQPAPAVTAAPEATAVPEVTDEPEVTAEPEATAEPEETAEPETTTEPEVTD